MTATKQAAFEAEDKGSFEVFRAFTTALAAKTYRQVAHCNHIDPTLPLTRERV